MNAKEVTPSSSKELMTHKGSKISQNIPVEGSEDVIQNQIIILPEIMSKVLEHLDWRTLKQARLVCKSWLLEAQVHMEKRGIVRVTCSSTSTRVQQFIKIRQKSILPQTFTAIEVDIECNEYHGCWDFNELKSLIPPVVIARLTTLELFMSDVISVLNRHASSLEYLKISLPDSPGANLFPPLRSGCFPKLRHVSIDTRNSRWDADVNSFASLIAEIVKGSPNLETYECKYSERSQTELTSKLVLQVDIRNVKTLAIHGYKHPVVSEAFAHFLSIPFRRLQNLSLALCVEDAQPMEKSLIATVAKSTLTLRTLDLSDYVHLGALTEFPVCLHVQELTISSLWPYSNNFISDRFPSLQVLNVHGAVVDENLLDRWKDMTPLIGLKTLRVLGTFGLEGGWGSPLEQLPTKFFEKFPDLERLRLDIPSVLACYRTLNPVFLKRLQGLKHLELYQSRMDELSELTDADGDVSYHSLSALTGLETITMVQPNEKLILIPFKDMPFLKTIQFPWGAYMSMDALLEMARGLEKVVITNCCSFPRTGEAWANYALDSFFRAAPNAECGCKSWKETSPKWNSFTEMMD